MRRTGAGEFEVTPGEAGGNAGVLRLSQMELVVIRTEMVADGKEEEVPRTGKKKLRPRLGEGAPE